LDTGDSKAPTLEGPNSEYEAGLDVKVNDNQEWTTVTEDTFSIDQVVTIPAFRSITIDGTIDVADNVELSFTSQILVSMSTIRLTKYSRAVVKKSLPRYQIRENLLKHVDGRIISDTEDGILFETNGTLRGTYGIAAVLHVRESPVISG